MNKKMILSLLVITSICGIAGCNKSSGFKKTNSDNYDIIPLVGENEATDYSKDENWMYKQTEAKNAVDLIYFYPTVTLLPNYYAVSKVCEEMKFGAQYGFHDTASCFKDYTNVFAPYHTQIVLDTATDEQIDEYCRIYNVDKTKLTENMFSYVTYSHARTDVYAALDYYFEHFNNGRPFILAGHSQGSTICEVILSEYMRVHPEFLSRMVATYAGGFTITHDYLRNNPHLKAAEGETDTGVIISWATEGPGATGTGPSNPPGSISINLLNWKTDETYADSSLNKGILHQLHPLHTYVIITEGELPDCQVNLKRGSLVTTFNDQAHYPYEESPIIAGNKSYHTYDYSFYYMNLRENGAKRIANYLGIDYETLLQAN